jgi:hypothetical protein
VLLSASSLVAGTPGSVTCPASPTGCQPCTQTDPHGAQSCTIRIYDNAGAAASQVVDLNGNLLGSPNQLICLDSNVSVTFQSDPARANAYFGLLFGTANPFQAFSHPVNPVAAVIAGGTIAGAPSTSALAIAVPATPPACYSYFISYCEYSTATPARCLIRDPQVIVDGGQKIKGQSKQR